MDYLNELSDLSRKFGKKKIDGNEFHGKVKVLLNDSRLKAMPDACCLLLDKTGNKKSEFKNLVSRICFLHCQFTRPAM
ncbi:MAG: hypothetical protein ACUZ8H_14885 [Candidatus Anammoxibacter sp.]